jgi:hypothetical protein
MPLAVPASAGKTKKRGSVFAWERFVEVLVLVEAGSYTKP